MSAPLKDQAARTRFIKEPGTNFCVSAGAGVGKTTAIVERVARLALRDSKSLPNLVVVTFGKAAAEELKVRCRERILGQLRPSAHLRQSLLSDLRRAFFGTIHSFCLKLIQEQGRFLGLPRNVDLLEESDDEDLWALFSESSRLDACQFPEKALATVLRFLSFDDLLGLARKIDPLSAEKIKAGFVETPAPRVDFAVSLADGGGRSRENTAKHQKDLRQWLEDFAADVPFLELPNYTTGSGTFKTAFREEMAPFAAWLGGLAGLIAAEIALAYRDYRLEQGFMTYADQILWCRQLIEDEAVLDRLRERRYSVILDEAQDTDAEMFSILTEITRPVGSAIDEWPRNSSAPGPEPGRFSFVGDEQQAIYGKANLEVYSSYINAFKEGRGGENLEFSVTMRCPARVIKTVNALFFAGARMKQTYVDFRELLGKPGCGEGDSWLLPLNPSLELQKVEEVFLHECEQVAEFLARFQPGGLGVSGWGEIAILCPRHKWLAAAQQTFRRFDLPCRLVAEKKIDLELAHRSWPAALLYTLVNPWDRFELIGVLREIFAISDVDLAEAYLRNEKRLTLNLTEHLSPRLASALALLKKLHAGIPSGKGTLSSYVDRVLDETALAARLEATGNQPEGLDAFRFQAMQAECDGIHLRDWIDGVCNSLRQSSGADTREGDEMQLLTCMKAKGLEWPVVIPLGLGRDIEDQNQSYPRVERRGTKVHLCAATIEPEVDEESKLRNREELERVLYVTLTRSKSMLVLPDSSGLYKSRRDYSDDGKKKNVNFLSLAKWRDLDHSTFLQGPSPRVSPQAAAKAPEFRLHTEPSPAVLEAAIRNSRAIPERILPHSLVSEEALPDYLSDSYPATEIGGIDYGQWWHKTLERFPWAKGAAAREQYGREIKFPPVFQERAAREWTDWVQSDPCKQIAAEGKNFLSEVPFSHPRSPMAWMEGVIDLIVVTRRDEIWILDWKTDRLLVGEREDDFRARMKGHYAPQLAAYREVLENGMKRKVSRLVLYSTELAAFIE